MVHKVKSVHYILFFVAHSLAVLGLDGHKLCLPALSADGHCKQFGSRLGPKIVGPDLDPN